MKRRHTATGGRVDHANPLRDHALRPAGTQMTRPPNPELVDSILSITTDLVAEKGSARVTLREVAGLAGVTTTTIHYYFGDRAGLFEEAKLRGIDDLDAAIDAATRGHASAAEEFQALAGAFISWSLANPHAFALVFDALPPFTDLDAALTSRYYASFERLREVYQRGVESGEFALDDVDLQATVDFGTIYGAVQLTLSQRLPPQYWADPAPVFERALANVMTRLRAAPVPGAGTACLHGSRALSDADLEGLAAAGDGVGDRGSTHTSS